MEKRRVTFAESVWAEGWKEGWEIGRQENARELLRQGLSVAFVGKVTEMSPSQVRKIQAEMKEQSHADAATGFISGPDSGPSG